jgi:hypothetical protein
VRVKGKWVYLYRAVDSTGATIDFLLSAKRDAAAAERFLTKALGGENHPAPRVINTDKYAAYPPAIVQLKDEGALKENCGHRSVQYLNNVLEQDHRAIKRRIRASQHFRSFWGAWRTIAGYEAIHHDPQRPSVWKCGGRESRSAPTASFSVCSLQRVTFPIIYPTFGSTTKLPHYRAHVYKPLWTVEAIFRTTKSLLETPPIYPRWNETLCGHVF